MKIKKTANPRNQELKKIMKHKCSKCDKKTSGFFRGKIFCNECYSVERKTSKSISREESKSKKEVKKRMISLTEEQKKKLLGIFKEYPRKNNLLNLSIESDFTKVAKNHVSLVKPFFEFVILKDESFKFLLKDFYIDFLVRKLPVRISSYFYLSEKETFSEEGKNSLSEEEISEMNRLRKKINVVVQRFYGSFLNLETIIFYLISGSPEDLFLGISEIPKKLKEENGK